MYQEDFWRWEISPSKQSVLLLRYQIKIVKKKSINIKSIFPSLFLFLFFSEYTVSTKIYKPSRKYSSDLEFQLKRNPSGFTKSYLDTSNASVYSYWKYFSPWWSWCHVLWCPVVPWLSELHYEIHMFFSLIFLEGGYKWSMKTGMM